MRSQTSGLATCNLCRNKIARQVAGRIALLKGQKFRLRRPYLNYGRYTYFQIFPANNDRNSIVAHVLRPGISARYIKIKPYTWFGHISMRFEVYGQRQGEINQQIDACVNIC